ncbi:lipocalin-like domain-containing protein [Bacteroides salyersiae]|nr:lipocalin-like domain-containing protein [Bacteroides salyersiae]
MVIRCFMSVFAVFCGNGLCSDDEDKLTNKWQLRRYEFPDGTTQAVDSVFYNFQKGSFSAICLLADGNYQTFFGNYSLQDDKISIILLPEYGGPEYDKYIGWEENKRIFHVDELSSSSLRLNYEGIVSVFRKY